MSEFWYSNWDQKQVGELCDVIDPHPSHRAPKEELNGIFFLGIGDLKENGEVIGDKARKVSPRIFDEHQDYYRITDNTIGFCRVASVGKVIEFRSNYPFKITISPTLAIIEPKGIDKKFLAYCLRSRGISDQVSSLSSGSTRESLGIKMLRELMIPVPPLPEQKKIAEILSGIDNQVTLIESQVKQAASAGTALAKQLLSSFNGDFLPLSEVATNYDSQRVPIKSIDREDRRGPYRYFGASGVIDMIDDYLFDGEFILVGEDGANIIDRNKPLAFRVAGKFWVNNHAHVIQPNNLCDLSYLTHYLESLDYTGIASGSAQPKITRASLDSIQIPIPPIEDQRKIGAAIDSAFNLAKRLDRKKHKLVSIKSAISSDLLSGRKRVSV